MYYFITILLLLGAASCAPSVTNLSPFIVGGSDANEGQFPFIALLETIVNPEVVCGGAILNNRWIVTAGFCVTNEYYNLRVRVGTTHIDDLGNPYDVERYEVHPDYNGEIDFDIGLLRTASDIAYGAYVQSIAIDYTPLGANQALITLGWGWNDDHRPNTLQFLTVLTVDQAVCYEAHDTNAEEFLCTTSLPGYGSCSFDDGNPLILNEKLVAVKSRMFNNCGDNSSPEGNIRLSAPFVLMWIENLIHT